MKRPESLDELISKKAAEFADQIKAAAAMADKEEEIRIEAERQLASHLKLRGETLSSDLSCGTGLMMSSSWE